MKASKKILIMRREGSLGDSILTRGYYSSIKSYDSSIMVDVFCLKPSVPFLKTIPEIDRLHVLNMSKLRTGRCWLSFLFWGIYFRLQNYDYIIDDNPYDGRNWEWLALLAGKKKYLRPEQQISDVKQKCRHFMNLLCIPWTEKELPISKNATVQLNEYLEKNKIERYVCINCFGSEKDKTFSPETFAMIVKKAKESDINYPIIFPYMPRKNIAGYYMKTEKEEVFFCKTNTPENLFALISDKRNFLTITVDTSVVHIADIYKKNTIVVYRNDECLNTYLTKNPNAYCIIGDRKNVNIFNFDEFGKGLNNFSKKLV